MFLCATDADRVRPARRIDGYGRFNHEAGAGQVFRYRPGASPRDGGALELLAESDGRAALDQPDNITVAPSGDVFACEDGPGAQHVRRISAATGPVATLARNAASEGELTGVCFAPDGRAMFVNLQREGVTLAVTGPFAGPGR